MCVVRKLEKRDKEQLENLIDEITNNLENEYFWLTINDESRSHFFDESWTYFLGMFDGDKLIATAGLFLNENEYLESQSLLKLEKYKVAEIGRAMVSPEYRGRGMMKIITEELVSEAEHRGIEYLLATAHPSNMPSIKSLESIGMKKEAYFVKNEFFERNIYLMKCNKK